MKKNEKSLEARNVIIMTVVSVSRRENYETDVLGRKIDFLNTKFPTNSAKKILDAWLVKMEQFWLFSQNIQNGFRMKTFHVFQFSAVLNRKYGRGSSTSVSHAKW